MLTLALLTFFLFLASLTARARHSRYETRVKKYEERLYPLILDFMEGELGEQEVEEALSGNRLEYVVFENIIIEMLDTLEGEEVDRLQKLLYLPHLFDHHVKQLNSGNDIKRIEACNYFGHVRLINHRIIEQLMEYVYANNQMLAFSSASALMASNDVSIRAEALKAVARRPRISNMALLELLYKFRYEPEDQLEEEGAELKKIMLEEQLPVDNIDLLIIGISEIGYHQLADPFLKLIKSDKDRWNKPDVLSALIQAMGNYFNLDAAPTIRKYIYHENAKVRRTTAETLGVFGQEEDLKALYNMLYDDDFQVKLTAAEALLENGQEGLAYLKRSFQYDHLETKPIAESIQN